LDVISANKKTKYGDVTYSWRHYEQNVLAKEKVVVDPMLQLREVPPPNGPGRLWQAWIFFDRSTHQIMGAVSSAHTQEAETI